MHNCPSQSQGRNYPFSFRRKTMQNWSACQNHYVNLIQLIGCEIPFSFATPCFEHPPTTEVHGLRSHLSNTTKDHIFNLGAGENTLCQPIACSMIVCLQVSASKTTSPNSHTTTPKAIPLSRGVVAAQAGHRTQRHPAPLDGSLQGMLKCEDATKSKTEKRDKLINLKFHNSILFYSILFYSGWFDQMLHNAYLPVNQKQTLKILELNRTNTLHQGAWKLAIFLATCGPGATEINQKTHQD